MNKTSSLLFAAALTFALTISAMANIATEESDLKWQFNVALNGKPVGSHSFELRQDGSQQILETTARFDVKFLFVTAFRYRHQSTEVWSDGCLSRIEATTESNGKRFDVQGSSAGNEFRVSSSEGSATLSGCVQSFAYWNPAVLDSTRLLNSQTGEFEDVSVTFEQSEQLDVGGKPVEALRYRLSAEAGDITLWYSSDDQTWLGLEAPAKGGRTISYTAVSVPEQDTVAQLFAASN